MQQLTNQSRLKPWMGFVLFAVVMGLFVTLCAYMQMNWGIIGLVATELLFLLLAVLYAVIFRIPFKEMFPVKKFTARDFFGSVLLMVGGVNFGLISVAVVGTLIPSSLEGSDVQSLINIMSGPTGYLLLILIVAVLPAVCEEAIHRGAILSNFRSIKKDWVIVLIMALFFGINHMSVLRFINTAILGACLSYIVIKKNNIILSSLMHFGVNFFSTSLSYFAMKVLNNISGGESVSNISLTSDSLRQVLGTYLIGGVTAPFLIVFGLWLLNPATHKKRRFLIAAIVASVMMISGFTVSAVNLFRNQLVQTTEQYIVSQEYSESRPIEFYVEKESSVSINIVMANAEGDYSVRIRDASGEVVHDRKIPDGTMRIYQDSIMLKEGKHKISIVNGEGTDGESPSVSIMVNRK